MLLIELYRERLKKKDVRLKIASKMKAKSYIILGAQWLSGFVKFVYFDFLRAINNISVKQGWVFLG